MTGTTNGARRRQINGTTVPAFSTAPSMVGPPGPGGSVRNGTDTGTATAAARAISTAEALVVRTRAAPALHQ
jgi:hypothetical protein